MNNTNTTIASKRKYKKITLIGLGVGGALAAVSCAVFFTLNYTQRVTTDDLFSEAFETSIFVRPRQWDQISITATDPSGSTVMYGDTKDSSTTTAVMAFERNDVYAQYTDETASNRSEIRTIASALLTNEFLYKRYASVSTGCSSPNDIVVSQRDDTQDAKRSYGLLRIDSLCNDTKLALRVVLGYDGKLRMLGVVAPESNWKPSSEAYNRMLESITQAPATP